MGGGIELKSEPGKGAAFHVFLPLRGEPSPPPAPFLLVPDGPEARDHAAAVLGALGLGDSLWTGGGDPPPDRRIFAVAAQGRERKGPWPVLTLPLRPSRLLTAETPSLAHAAPGGHGGRVLVVDDNQVNLRVVQLLLERAGCDVDTAANGVEGVARARDGYDLILMDCLMPEMDGWQATEEIRRREAGEEPSYIVALTANAFAEDRERCRKAGMDDFLAKPVRRADLLRVLADARARRQARGGA
jgi:CheY-like chemotaxis protein